MFFDIQVVTLLLKEFTLFATSASPLPGHACIFQQYLQHTYVCIQVRWDVREALAWIISVHKC